MIELEEEEQEEEEEEEEIGLISDLGSAVGKKKNYG